MALGKILSYYIDIARKEDIKLNVATFEEMYQKLRKGIKDKKILKKILWVYESYKSPGMDYGFKINSETFKYAIPEFRACLTNFFGIYKK